MNKNREIIKLKVLEIVKNITENKVMDLKEGALLKDAIGIDSLDYMDLWLSVEQALKVDIPEKEVRKCETVCDLIDLIERNMKG